MKRPIIALLAAFIMFLIVSLCTYLIISIASLQFNTSLWGNVARIAFTGICMLLGAIFSIIAFNFVMDEENIENI